MRRNISTIVPDESMTCQSDDNEQAVAEYERLRDECNLSPNDKKLYSKLCNAYERLYDLHILPIEP